MKETDFDPKLSDGVISFASLQADMAKLIREHGVTSMLLAIDYIDCGPLPFIVQSSRELIQDLYALDTHNRDPKKRSCGYVK